MKNKLTLLIPLFAAAWAPLLAAETPHHKPLRILAEAKEPGAKVERHIVIRHGDDEREMETVAFLGVETSPVSPALTAQLALPKGAGLVVRHIVPDSPAAAVLQQHDVLLKFDDQLLIEPRQFSVLVRNHKEGDEIELTYVRAGKQATAKVKLTKHEVPKIAFFHSSIGGEGGFAFGMGKDDDEEAGPRHEEMQRMLSLLDQRGAGKGSRAHVLRIPASGDVGFRAMKVNPGNSNMVFSDDQGSLELTIKDGKKSLVAKNAKGEQLYAGAIDTPEQRNALPGEVRERLEKIEGMQDFSFEAGDDFKDQVKFVHPQPSKIALPLPTADWTAEAPPPTI